MVEIAGIPWNGFTVASTFSGCGGSCLGYRMAGFKVAWANEFVPAAQDSYRANAPDCYLDPRDIRDVQPEEVLEVLGMKEGDLDLFDGSPPCQAFSTAGKREKGWGELKTYEHGAKQANETLFSEYIRLLRGLKPKVFVAENVSGLVKGTAKGYFLEILAALKASGYRVTCRVLDAQWLGVPQQRQRTIFVGVREDLNREPAHPEPLPYRYSVRDALPWITANGTGPSFALWKAMGRDPLKTFQSSETGPIQAVLATGVSQGVGMCEAAGVKRKFTIDELKCICGFPDDFILKGTYAQQWERLGNSVPPVMMSHIAKTIRDKILNGTQ
jgi:DNA (cytosine-5)-methyltransferase 1